ncbi:hypothetical protein DYH09_14545, partial [bacterium CPR1]|nr:hypothetical protein [bacterium CPR1]
MDIWVPVAPEVASRLVQNATVKLANRAGPLYEGDGSPEAGVGRDAKKTAALLNYFVTHRDRMQYAAFRKRG